MSYNILPTKQFYKDFKRIKDKKFERAITDKMKEVSQDPKRYKRLHYELKGSFREGVGPFRVLYSIDEKREEMYLEKIIFDHRYGK